MKSKYLHGIITMVLSSLVFSIMAIFVKMAAGVNIYLITTMRFATGIIVVLIILKLSKMKLDLKNRKWLIIRGISGSISVFMFFYGIVYIGLGKGTMLNYTYPIFATLFAPFFLKEKIKPDIILAIIVAFIGVFFLVKPDGLNSFDYRDLMPLSGAVSAGIAIMSIKKLREDTSAYSIFFAFSMIGSAMFIIPAVNNGINYSVNIWGLLLLIGVLSAVAQLLLTYSYKFVGAAEGSIVAFMVPAFNIVLGILFFNEKFTSTMIFGCCLVFVACLYTIFKEEISKKIYLRSDI